jgi:hypothetical protein
MAHGNFPAGLLPRMAKERRNLNRKVIETLERYARSEDAA